MVLLTDPETSAPVEAKCTVVGYDLWDDLATTVMVNVVFPKGYVAKKLLSEEELEQAKLQASKLYKSLA